jgi:hypothetical protein
MHPAIEGADQLRQRIDIGGLELGQLPKIEDELGNFVFMRQLG